MNKRISLGAVFAVILVGAFFYFTIFSGIKDLNAQRATIDSAKQGEVIEYSVIYAKDMYEIRHKLFGIIPTYSEHFYVTLSESGIDPLVVKADEKWFSENFNADGFAKSPTRITALIKSSGSKKGLYLDKVNAQLSEVGHIDTGRYADTCYVFDSILRITAGGLAVTAVLTVFLTIILFSKGVLIKGGVGVNIMVIAAIIQVVAFIVLMVMI